VGLRYWIKGALWKLPQLRKKQNAALLFPQVLEKTGIRRSVFSQLHTASAIVYQKS
jgi:hypothetical protein